MTATSDDTTRCRGCAATIPTWQAPRCADCADESDDALEPVITRPKPGTLAAFLNGRHAREA